MRADLPPELLSSLEGAVEALTATHRLRGGELRFRCPAHSDNDHPSADWNPEKATWFCRTCSAGGGAVDLANRLGVELPRLEPKARAKAPVGKKRYELRNQAGFLVAVHGREDKEDGKKEMWWELPDGTSGLGGLRPWELPLYWPMPLNIGDHAPQVFVTEGERAADALSDLGYQVAGTACGASATPGEPILRELCGGPHDPGTRPYLWPDNDDDGRKHMARIAQALWDMGVTDIHIVTWKDAPRKGDAADWAASDDAGEFDTLEFEQWSPPPKFVGKHLTVVDVGGSDEVKEDKSYLVQGLIPRGVCTALIADGGTGKSNIAIGACTALAAGVPFAQIMDTAPGIVPLYLDWEDTQAVLKRRVAKCSRGLRLPRRPTIHHGRMRSLLRVGMDEVKEAVELLGVNFIVVDAVGMAQGASERSAEGATLAFFEALNQLPDGITVLLLDHLDKNSVKEGAANAKAYGSVYKWAECRVIWGAQTKDEQGDLKLIELNQVKNNHDKRRIEPLELVLDWTNGLTFRPPRSESRRPEYQQQNFGEAA